MLILSAKQIRDWDIFTITNKSISSIHLMETAAKACCQWLQQYNLLQNEFHIFCGKGNNGGDGLAIARILATQKTKVVVHIIELAQKNTADFQTNLNKLHHTNAVIHYVQKEAHFPIVNKDSIIIDALYGTGLNRPLEGLSAQLVKYINTLIQHTIIAIDMPSGLLADASSKEYNVIKATHTLSFQCLKMALVMAENEAYIGNLHVLDIGLLPAYTNTIVYETSIIETTEIKEIYKPRKKFSHKGTYGHAAIIAGSYGFMGAATLTAKACIKTGVGKLTCHLPLCGYEIMQIAVPEAMSKVEQGEHYIENISDLQKYNAIGIGPGIGLHTNHAQLLKNIFTFFKKPMVIDADALNTLAQYPALLQDIPPFSILTPHPTEFERLFGKQQNDFARMRLAQQKAKELQLIIVLKGHKTCIAMPGGKLFFNNTGNPGMATGGSGDVLAGILTSLLAQGYLPQSVALLGVYLHGLAGDFAAAELSEEAMIASDITQYLGNAFKAVKNL